MSAPIPRGMGHLYKRALILNYILPNPGLYPLTQTLTAGPGIYVQKCYSHSW